MMKEKFQFKFDRNTFFYLLLFILYVFLMPRSGHEWDMHCWLEWTKNIYTNGLAGVYRNYEHTTDYLPLYHYFLFAFAKFQGSITNIEKNIHYLKLITLLFDFIGGFFFVRLIREHYKDANKLLLYSLLLFLNIAYFYNTLIWGQVDGIMTTLIFISLFYAIKERILTSLIFIVLALNFKLQSIIFLPLILLILLPSIIGKFSLKNLFTWLLIPSLLQIIIVLPFVFAGNFDNVWKVAMNSIGKSPVISIYADNMWYWLIRGDLKTIHDTGTYLVLSYKNWGLLLFFATSFIALLPLLINTYSIFVQKSKEKIASEKILLTAALLPLIFFFFNTEMHERYSHPAIILVATYSILTKRFVPYIFISVAYVLNLEAVLKYLALNTYSTLVFDPRFVAGLFLATILLLFHDLFTIYGKIKFVRSGQDYRPIKS